MEDHETRRKIIRQWMALPKDKRQTADQAAAFAKRAVEHRRAAEQRDERAALHHSITSSAVASSDGGISRPNAFAVLRLITSSNFVGCITGRSAGLAPFRRRPA